MPDNEISETGVFVDIKTGQVVTSPPEEGVQLCAPGGELTPEVQRDIKLAREAAGSVETAIEPAVEEATSAKPSRKAKADDATDDA